MAGFALLRLRQFLRERGLALRGGHHGLAVAGEALGGVGLLGGEGADVFKIFGDGACDKVSDFNALEGDVIDGAGFSLLTIDVDVALGVSTAYFDNNNDGIADACIQVNGVLDPVSILL